MFYGYLLSDYGPLVGFFSNFCGYNAFPAPRVELNASKGIEFMRMNPF
jgi:hypothetical protein